MGLEIFVCSSHSRSINRLRTQRKAFASDGISYGRWEPRQALDAVIEEVAAILAEQAAEIAALKANAHYHGGERENP